MMASESDGATISIDQEGSHLRVKIQKPGEQSKIRKLHTETFLWQLASFVPVSTLVKVVDSITSDLPG